MLTCEFLNARSIVSKMLELEERVYEENPDMYNINKSWAKSFIYHTEISLQGYDMIRKDRTNRKGSR